MWRYIRIEAERLRRKSLTACVVEDVDGVMEHGWYVFVDICDGFGDLFFRGFVVWCLIVLSNVLGEQDSPRL